METVAFSALRKLPFNQESCIFLTAGTFKKALSAFTFFFRRAILILAEVLYNIQILEMSVGAFPFSR